MSTSNSSSLPSAAAVLPVIDLTNTFGAILIGTFFALILYGVTLHQAYNYTRSNYGDSIWKKSFIVFIIIVDTLHAVLCMHTSYHELVTNYFFPLKLLLTNSWSLNFLSLQTAITVIPCQAFLAYRVVRVGGRKYMPIVIVAIIMMLAELGLATAATVKGFTVPTLAKFQHYTWTITAAYAIASVMDLGLTSALLYCLRQHRSSFATTNNRLDLLTAYTMSTGLLTTVFEILVFVISLVKPQDLIYTAMNMVSTKIYTNTILAAINLRQTVHASDGFGSNIKVPMVLPTLSSDSSGTSRNPTAMNSEEEFRPSVNPLDIEIKREFNPADLPALGDMSAF